MGSSGSDRGIGGGGAERHLFLPVLEFSVLRLESFFCSALISSPPKKNTPPPQGNKSQGAAAILLTG